LNPFAEKNGKKEINRLLLKEGRNFGKGTLDKKKRRKVFRGERTTLFTG